jgi:FAD-linked sulfhydryl oxidase
LYWYEVSQLARAPSDEVSSVQFVFATLALFHAPTRAHVDPWTGDLFGEGGVEQQLHKLPQQEVVGGGVIMSKLGNATAK